jgi:hypothetical protein
MPRYEGAGQRNDVKQIENFACISSAKYVLNVQLFAELEIFICDDPHREKKIFFRYRTVE